MLQGSETVRHELSCRMLVWARRAKRWSGKVLILQAGLFVAAVVAIFWPRWTLTYPWLAFPFALFGAWVSARASGFKSMAESAKRQHEYVVDFGVKPSGAQLADLRQDLKKELSPGMANLLKLGITYASGEPQGPRRDPENLCESAWFTKHLARRCVYWVAGTFIVTLAVGVSLLLYSTANINGTEAGTAAAKSVAATFTFLMLQS
jgi:hypothetical protein